MSGETSVRDLRCRQNPCRGRQLEPEPRQPNVWTHRPPRDHREGLDSAAIGWPISVPLLVPDVGEAEALTEILHVLDHVVQATDEDLLAPVVRDIVLDDLLNVAHAAFPIRRLGTRDGRVEVKIRMLPLPLLDEAAVDQVVHVSHAEDDVELMAPVEA